MGAVRPEYRKLADDLPRLASEFGCRIPDAAARDLLVFTLATECIDRVLDALEEADERRRFSRALLAALHGDSDASARFPLELQDHVAALALVIARHGLTARFCALAARALDNTERMRTTERPGEWVACVEEEGRLTVELALLFVAAHANPAFVRFFRSVAELGNLVDKLKDARGDHRRGEMALRPGLRVHARLLGALVRRTPRAATRHPRLGAFVAWGLGYLG